MTTLHAAPTSTPASPPPSGGATAPSDLGAVIASVTFFSILSLAAAITSQGFLEADACTHYLYARFAIDEPHYLVNIWGRPLVTALYAIPANVAGRFGVRAMSLALAIAIALIAYAISKRLRLRRPVLALIFTLAQPLVFLHSFSELTELPFALLLGLAFLAYLDRRWLYFVLLVSILPLARPEGFGFVALAAIALLLHRRPWWILWLPVPLVVWDYTGWTLYGIVEYPWWQWLSRNWPYAEKSAYQSGSLFHFLILMPAVVSPLLLPAMALGVWQLLKAPRRQDRQDRQEELSRMSSWRSWRSWRLGAMDRFLVVVIPLMILAGHSVLYATGRMASSGEVRYMLVVAPFWAVLAAKGWEWLFARRGWRREVQLAMLASILPIFVNRSYQVLPLAYSEDWIEAREAGNWVLQTPLSRDYPKLATSHPGLFYFMDISATDRYRVVEWRKGNIVHPPKGVILVWDWVYGTHNSDADRVITVEDLLRAGWVPIAVPRVQDSRPAPNTRLVFLSPRDALGRPTVISAAPSGAATSTTRGFPSPP